LGTDALVMAALRRASPAEHTFGVAEWSPGNGARPDVVLAQLSGLPDGLLTIAGSQLHNPGPSPTETAEEETPDLDLLNLDFDVHASR
jgi:hypothetical protein